MCGRLLTTILASNFACSDIITDAPSPGLEVQDLGLIGFPLSTREAEILKARCRQSPFGKGETTLVDSSVRSSWELDASQFKIVNPEWDECIVNIVFDIHDKLGLAYGDENIKAQPYKLLIYGEDAFFKAHQDSEKADGMFGTLVVSLPSKHEGGKVSFSHNGLEEEYDSAQYGPFATSYGAWYSDVYHEVQPVTSGYRVVLTYNLVQHVTDERQGPPDGEALRIMRQALERYEIELTVDTKQNRERDPGCFVHKLEHLYSEHSLNVRSLKGDDAAQVQHISNACKAAGFQVYLALLEKEVSEDQVMPGEEAYRKEKYIHVTTLDGTKQNVKPEYHYSHLLDQDEESEGHYAGSEHDEYTGNEGAMSTWRYRVSVVVMVPPSRQLEFTMAHDHKLRDALNDFPALRSKAEDDAGIKSNLYDLCQLVLRSKKPRDYWNDRDSADYQQRADCLNQVVLTAIENGWLHLADMVILEHSQKPEHLQAYARYVSTQRQIHIRQDSL